MTSPYRSRMPGNERLADPADVFGAARVCFSETTPVLQPRTLKRADAVPSAVPAIRPVLHVDAGLKKIKNQSRPGCALLTVGAIDVLGVLALLLKPALLR